MGIFDQNQRSQGSGMSGRLIAAVIMALIGLFMYWSSSEVNPVTGKKQHVSLSPDQEIKLGLQSAPEMAKEMGGELPSTDPRTQLVQKVGNHLVETTQAKKSPWKFKFHLLADKKMINAFALPGGQIFITLGLLEKLETEDQLAGVLGHEMGHVIERHTAQQMAKSQLGNILVVAVATGATDPNNPSNNAMMAASMVNQMVQLRYGRKDESDSDIWGIKLMRQAGYDPKAMIEVLKVLKASSGGADRGPELFQSHPNPDLRIEQIQEYFKQYPEEARLLEGKSLKENL